VLALSLVLLSAARVLADEGGGPTVDGRAIGILTGTVLIGLVAYALFLYLRPLLIARYYVLTTASPAAGMWDWLRHGTSASWEAAEGTR